MWINKLVPAFQALGKQAKHKKTCIIMYNIMFEYYILGDSLDATRHDDATHKPTEQHKSNENVIFR